MAKLIINGKEETYEDGIKLLDIARFHKDAYRDDIVLAKYNGGLTELSKAVNEDAEVEF